VLVAFIEAVVIAEEEEELLGAGVLTGTTAGPVVRQNRLPVCNSFIDRLQYYRMHNYGYIYMATILVVWLFVCAVRFKS